MAVKELLWMKDFLQDDLYLLDDDKNPSTDTAATPTQEKTVEIVFNCLGQKDAGFLILATYSNDEHMAIEHLKSLENILSRKGEKLADVVIVNLDKQKTKNFDAVSSYFAPEKILIMGEGAIPEGLTIPDINTVDKTGNVKLLYTFGFEEMLQSDDKKRMFWNQMKSF